MSPEMNSRLLSCSTRNLENLSSLCQRRSLSGPLVDIQVPREFETQSILGLCSGRRTLWGRSLCCQAKSRDLKSNLSGHMAVSSLDPVHDIVCSSNAALNSYPLTMSTSHAICFCSKCQGGKSLQRRTAISHRDNDQYILDHLIQQSRAPDLVRHLQICVQKTHASINGLPGI